MTIGFIERISRSAARPVPRAEAVTHLILRSSRQLGCRAKPGRDSCCVELRGVPRRGGILWSPHKLEDEMLFRGSFLLLAAASVLLTGCTTTRLTRVAEIAGARSEAHDLVTYVKANFQPGDPEYAEAEIRYAALKGEYECWLAGLIEAVETGRNPAEEGKYSPCPNRAVEKRDDFVSYVRSLRPRPTTTGQTNPEASIPSNETVFERAARMSGPVLTLFDSLVERWFAYRDRYRLSTKEQREKEAARLQTMHWNDFCDNR